MSEPPTLPPFSGYPLDMFAPIDMERPGLQPPDTPLVRILRRGRSAYEGGAVNWLHEARDEVSRHSETDFFERSTQQWAHPPDADGWFYSYWSYPVHSCDHGCDEEPFVDVRAVRWVNADQIPEGERHVAGRPLNPDGTPHQRRPQSTRRRGFAQIAVN
ncbi:Uncharacterised protein [Mycobacteroides abscessus subsp. abscessus]|uniref:Nucleotide modification associated domain-containing protein n=4 Tax=Mycobacteroides TaxID=670516 RepID=A0AB74FAI3_9MYCO|nr:hypothetical protein [Mycobacteroides abscessus]MDB2197414.1 hypothetical protein [Mycobacteroides abscessus subsp. abscessus]MDB2202911.1 hypothetical protein [Mycobacteroides abscessus subsp. abscessus]MDB2308711.1 hypothetical protein [Mycobacteroides abscessus subsp. massiliense]MDM2402227.1 hypothetical protein [Mycobacteroides abscessus]MDM2412353.1 hypothetical protein [Mycobacteroides abscessus]